MDSSFPAEYRTRAGALLRAAANDLKRDNVAADRELGLPSGTFADLTTGRAPLTWEILRRAAEVWPLNERDLLPIYDDCPDGLLINRREESIASSRVLQRGGRDYYEYRDTAMSRLSSYRPEWIKMLCTVSDNNELNPAVQWNNGHLLYQFTYFIGPVNYYYEWQGNRFCTQMNTGDSMWGLPFAPHSFAVRAGGEGGHILALTYAGELLGDPQRELSALGPRAVGEIMLHPGTDTQIGAALIRSFIRSRVTTIEYLARETGIEADRLEKICSAELAANHGELDLIAHVLGLSVRDLLPPRSQAANGVVLQRHADAARWHLPDDKRAAYHITKLASDPSHPETSAIEIDVLTTSADQWLSTHQHQYLYVLGQGNLGLAWRNSDKTMHATLHPGDSCYIRPGTPIAMMCAARQNTRALLLRIGGKASIDLRFALGLMPAGGLDRYLQEDRMWYSSGS